MIEGLNPPTTEDSYREFINTLKEHGAKIVADSILAEPYCTNDWCLMIISSAQAKALEGMGLDVKCRWKSLRNNCIIYIAKAAMELLELRHIPDDLVINNNGEVDRVSLLGGLAKVLNAVKLKEVGALEFTTCIGRPTQRSEEDEKSEDEEESIESAFNCAKYIIGRYDDVENAFVIEVERKSMYENIAILPRRMAYVYDPYIGDRFYVAWDEDGRILTYSKNLDPFLMALKDVSGGRYGFRDLKYSMYIGKAFKWITKPLSAGLNEDGTLSDPYGILDTTNHGVDDLINIYNWINKYYDLNARFAWLNIVFIIAKIITPILRKRNKEFIDFIIWNRGSGFEGKSTLVNEVGARILGVYEADPYLTIISGAINTIPQLRELVNLNRLPLIIDEQHETLIRLAGMLHASAIGQNWVGLHASRYGSGNYITFKNYRGIIVVTNTPFKRYYDEALRFIGGGMATIRRFTEFPWFRETLPEEAWDNLPLIKGPVYGLLMDLLKDDEVRRQLFEAKNLLTLSMRLMDAIGSKYPKFRIIADQTNEWLKELLQEKVSEWSSESITREDLRLSDYARQYCGSRISNYCELRALLEYGERDGEVVFTEGRDDNLGDVRTAIDAVIGRLFNGANLQSIIDGSASVKASDDALEAFRLLAMRLSSGQTRIVFKPGTTIVPGRPRSILGVEVSTYSRGGVKYKGYGVRIDNFLKWLFLGEGQ